MANPTTNYGWPMPTSTDLVTDLPADFAAFGQPVDTSLKALNPETTLGDIAYRSATANTNTRLGIGTTGQVLAVSGGVPAWTTPAVASSGMTLITRQSFSAVATTGTTFDGIFTSTYESYMVVIESLTNGGNGGNLEFQFRYAGPTTQAASYYGILYEVAFNQSALTFTQQGGTTSFTLVNNGGDSGQTTSGVIYFNKVGNTSARPKFYGSAAPEGVWAASFAGMNDIIRTYTGLLFKADTGNVTGTIAVYGLAK